MVNPSIRSAWDGVVLPPAGEAEGVIFQLIGYTIPAAASKRSALGATRPWLSKPVLTTWLGSLIQWSQSGFMVTWSRTVWPGIEGYGN